MIDPPTDAHTPVPRDSAQPSAPTSWGKKVAVVVVIALAMFAASRRLGETLTLQGLAARETELRELQRERPGLVLGMAFLIYVAVTGLSLPGAAVLTLVCAWFFGFWRGLVLVSFASTTGATVAFLTSRCLLRDVIQRRFGDRLATFNAALQREGAFYLFMLRLIPAVPFFVINVVMGLTPVRTSTYWWVSQLGMLPGTAVYVYAGSSVPHLTTLAETGVTGILSPRLLGAFVLLGVVPLVLKRVIERIRPLVSNAPSAHNTPAD